MAWMLDWEPDERFRHHTRANTGEVMSTPVSPLGWTLGWEKGVLKGWREGNIDIGLFREDELSETRPQLAGVFGGYLFLNLSAMRTRALRMPGGSVEMLSRAFIGDREDAPPYEFDPADECAECSGKTAQFAAWVLSGVEYPTADEDTAMSRELRDSRGDLSALTMPQLVSRARLAADRTAEVVRRAAGVAIGSAVGPATLEALCAEVGQTDHFMPLITGLGGVESADASTAIWRLSRIDPDKHATAFNDAITEFLREYGARGPNEYDIYQEVWETDPALVEQLLGGMRRQPDDKAPTVTAKRLEQERHAATRAMRDALSGMPEKLAQFETALRSAHMFLRYREQYKTAMVRCLHECRMAVRELGARAFAQGALTDPADVLMLLDSELDRFVDAPEEMKSVLSERHTEFRKLADRVPPHFLSDGLPAVEDWEESSTSTRAEASKEGEALTGVAACPGKGTGIARVVMSPADARGIGPGDVLIAPHTDPAWTPLFLSVNAVVVDTGARNSHAAIICRELGTPCVVSVTDATQRIPDGSRVLVDGDAGTVTLLPQEGPHPIDHAGEPVGAAAS